MVHAFLLIMAAGRLIEYERGKIGGPTALA
jgi:hypothetical protein